MLVERLRARAAASGPLPFSEFMEQALYDPTHGFYARRDSPYGDYFTSVSVHPRLFGRLLAAHLDDVWRALGRPRPFRVVDLGAADGRLARQLRAAAPDHPWGAALQLIGVERAPAPGAAEALDVLHGALGEVEPAPAAAVIANEFFDALPVRLARRTTHGWVESCVTFRGPAAALVDRPLPPDLRGYVQRYAADVPPGGRIEARRGVDEVYRHAARLGARVVMTTIDYGGPCRRVHSARLAQGTLLAYRRQQASEDVLAHPGHADLTAHVNFTQLADIGRRFGFTQERWGQQADFLAALGAGDYLLHLQTLGVPLADYQAQREAVFQLVSPTDLGRFQVLTQGKNVDLAGIRGLGGGACPASKGRNVDGNAH